MNFFSGPKESKLDFFENIIYLNPKGENMSTELECPICEADIPLDGDEKTGDLVLCSYCKVTFKLIKKKERWALVEDYEV